MGAVGDLTNWSGRRRANELADCRWSVLVLAKLYAVELEQALLTTMDELKAKLKTTG